MKSREKAARVQRPLALSFLHSQSLIKLEDIPSRVSAKNVWL